MSDGEAVETGGGEPPGFDYDEHERLAREAYRAVQAVYEALAGTIRDILQTAFREKGLFIHSIEARGKSLESFGAKCRESSEDDQNRPKYPDPLKQVTDLAAVRVITFFLDVVGLVDEVVSEQFDVLERSNKGKLLEDEEKLGYQSVHYLIRLKANRSSLPEYAGFRRLTAELQVRTILQHAWAEIEHDVQYKSVAALPATIRRRFLSLAGLLEIADREFQEIDREHQALREEARVSVEAGRLDDVEITGDSLKLYLDQRLGPDGRMSNWSYGWTVRLLLRMGFETIGDVDRCLDGYNDDRITRILWGTRQGQLQRFEDTIFASMGQNYLDRHIWADNEEMAGWRRHREGALQRLRERGVEVGNFVPEEDRRAST